jgi:[glutamine synthetase] adenylyltransferase / [glutamine synthetase]-adenylyl-L-tyrosine phosphorylase
MPFDARLAREVERSAAPGSVAAALERLFERDGDLQARLVEDVVLSNRLIAVLGASRSLAQLCATDPLSLEVLADLERRAAPRVADADELARWYQLEYLRIATRDLTGRDSLEATTAALSTLADDVLGAAWHLALPSAEGITVIGMGKLGAGELNYASDVDVLFVGDGDARPLLHIAQRCFRVDANLRPEGRDGPLVRTLASYEAYWDRWAQTWEFQALIKARAVTGPESLGSAFTDAAAARVWGRPFGADELRDVRAMKARAEGEIRRKGLSEREVKRGRGGIRDIEFAIQLLQLVHGRLDPSLRVKATLPALAELASAGYVDRTDAGRLADAYEFLRRVEHMLQLVDGAQVHAVPTDGAALDRLARVLGYRSGPDSTATAALLTALTHHQNEARGIHEHLFFRPLLELFAGAHVDLSPAAADARLAAFGFADAQRTRQALHELTHGLTRSSRLMQQLLPLLLGWLSEAPDPDGGLLGLRTLVASAHRADVVVPIFRDSPEAARRICLILGTSRSMAAGLERHPDVIAELAPAPADSADPTAGMPARVEAALEWRDGTAARLAGLRRFKEAEELRIATADILGLFGDRPQDAVDAVAARLTSLAEAVLAASMENLAPGPPFALIGMGRFGGAELSYASDLDVLLVHDATDPTDVGAAEAAAEELLRMVKGATPAERLFLLDADLRPEGRQGPLARSLAGYEAYYSRWAQTWERQALLRARPVAGDARIAERFMALARSVTGGGVDATQEREIRRMKARIERERIPARDDPEFHLKLGRGSLSDVEWTVQLLQLRHGVTCPGTMAALDALETAGGIDAHDASILSEAYRFCERTRNRLYLVRGSPGDALPARSDQLAVLARSLGMHAVELRATYRRVTRRAREVTERLFYGSTSPPATTRRQRRES